MASSGEESFELLSHDSDDPGDALLSNSQEIMSLDDKVDHLHQIYPELPPLMIKTVLKRSDVDESIDVAITHLDKIKGKPSITGGCPQGGKAQGCPQGGVKDKAESFKNEQSGSDSSTYQPKTLKEKEKHLQRMFKYVPPFIIRKILTNPEVGEDIELAKERLEKNASAKPTFNVAGGDQNQRGRRGGGRGGDRGRGWGNRGRQCWTAETNQNPERPSDTDQTSSGFAEQNPSGQLNMEESQGGPSNENQRDNNTGNKNRNKRNRNRNKKRQNRGQGTQGDYAGNQGQYLPPGSNYNQHPRMPYGGQVQGPPGNYNQQPSMPYGGQMQGPPGNYNQRPSMPYGGQVQGPPGNYNQRQSMPYGGQVQGPYYGAPEYGNPQFMGPPQPLMNVWTGPNSGFYQGYQQRNNDSHNNSWPNRGRQGGRGNMNYPSYRQSYPGAVNMRGNDFTEGFNQRNSGSDDHQETQPYANDRDKPEEQPQALEPKTISLHGLNENISEEYITNFIEARTHEDVMQITLSDDCKSAIITLRNLTDFNKAQQRVAEKQLEGCTVHIKRLPLCSSIMVTGLSPISTHNGILYHFSHKKSGGDVKELKLEDGHAIVIFEDPKAVNKALNPDRPHDLDGVSITVSKYYPFMYKDTNKKHPGKNDNVIIVDPDIMSFITASKHIKDLETTLQKLKFTLKYKPGERFAYISETGPMASKVEGTEAVSNFLKLFTTFKLHVDSESKEIAMANINEQQQALGEEKLHVVEKEDSLLVVCFNGDTEGLKKKLEDQIEESLKAEGKKSFETQEIDVDEEKLQLLKKYDFINNHLSKEQYPELEVELDEDALKLKLVGPKKEVSDAKVVLYRHIAKMRERQLSLTNTVIKMLSSDRGMSRIKALLEEENIKALFCIDENDPDNPVTAVIGMSLQDANDAAQLINRRTSEMKIKVDQDNREVVRSQRWLTHCQQLEATFNVHIHRSKYMDTWVAGFDDDVAIAHDKMKEFLDQNSLRTEDFCCQDAGVRKYLLEKRKDELNSIASGLAKYSVQIKPGQESSKLEIYGSKVGTDQARKAIHNLIDLIITKKVKIEQPGLQKLNTERIVKSVEQEHQCTIIPSDTGRVSRTASPSNGSDSDVSAYGAQAIQDGIDESSDDSDDDGLFMDMAPSMPTVSGQSVVYGNVKVSWKAANIVNENADILVASILGQLAKAFNVQTMQFSNLAQGNVQTVAGWGNLPCNHVILTHITDCRNAGATQILQTTVQKCLQEAIQLNARSIALPILGTAGLGFPPDVACSLMINEVINEVSQWQGFNSVTDVRFIVYNQNQQLVTTFQQEFNKATNSAGISSFNPPSPGNAGFSGNTGLPGNGVSVVSGDLLQVTTDAIVNIIGTDLNLNNAGQLSAKIAATYPMVQQELSGVGQQREGAVVITSSGRKIVHAVCNQVSQQNAQSAIEKCLKAADRYGFTSISLPSFGTGKSSLTAIQSAQAAFTAISNVQQTLNTLQNIQIVIYKDPTMLSTFQQEQQRHGIPPGKPKRNSSSKRSTLKRSSLSTQPKPSSFKCYTIYGKSDNNVDSASTSLIKSFAECCKTDTFNSEFVSKLSTRQRNLLRGTAIKLDVTIKFEDRAERIVIRGNSDDVTAMMKHIMEEIQERTKKETDREQATILYKTIRWKYELNGQTASFTKYVNLAIEKAHHKKDGTVTVKIMKQNVVIDLVNQTWREPATGRTGTVQRTHVGLHQKSGVIDIGLPKEWTAMPMVNGKEATVHLVNLPRNSTEYLQVHAQFKYSGGRGNIAEIKRIQNPHLYEQFMVHKKKMDKENVGAVNEMELFHGTSEANLDAINKNNFNRSFCGAHGTAYGNGVYFARDASYSMGYAKPGFSGYKHMYLARVLVGKYTAGSSGMLVPPPNPNTGNNFDSVANSNGSGASIFVVFYDYQCYPAYLIKYQ